MNSRNFGLAEVSEVLCNFVKKSHARLGGQHRRHTEMCEKIARILGGESNVLIINKLLYRCGKGGILVRGRRVTEFDILVDDRIVLEYETGLAQRYEKAIKLGIEKFFLVDIMGGNEVIVFKPVIVKLAELRHLIG